MRLPIQAACALLLTFCVACSSLGLAPAKSLSDRIAYGYSTYTAVQYAAANAITAGEISSADGEELLRLADQARVFLDGSKVLVGTDPQAAETKLELAVAILRQLQAHLRSKSA